MRGYWKNEEATEEAIDSEGWFHTGDLGELDSDGFLKITGRKKEILVTAGGKNVAPAVLEDRLRAHRLVSQCIVVGDQRPFIGALITLDEEALPAWLESKGKPADQTAEQVREDPELLAEIDAAVKDANKAVSHAEAIKKFTILGTDFTEDNGMLTPSLKLKRAVVMKEFDADVEAPVRPLKHRAALSPVPHAAGRGSVLSGRAGRRRSRRSSSRTSAPRPRPGRRRPSPGPAPGRRAGPATASATGAGRPRVDHVAGVALADRLRGAAGRAGDHRQAAGRRLEEDDAEPLDVEPAPGGCGRASRRRRRPRSGPAAPSTAPAPVKTTESASPPRGDGPAQRRLRRAAADQQQPRARDAGPARAASRPTSTSWPLRATSRDTQTTTGRVARARAAAAPRRRRRPG